MAVPQERLRVAESPAVAAVVTDALRVSWRGVWSGFLIAIGAMLVLATLGVALGVSTIDPAASDARSLGAGATLWAALTLLISVFIGGMVATRLGVVFDQPTSALHGALVWVLAMLAVLYLATAGVSLGVNTLLGVASGVVRAAGTAAAGSGGLVGELTRGDVNEILVRLDDPSTAAVVAVASGMSQDEARRMLTEVRQHVEAARSDPPRAVAEARNGLRDVIARAADRAADTAKKTSWAAFGAMVVSLLAAIGGALFGGRRAAARLMDG